MILSPKRQVEDSGRERQIGQTGQIGRTSHCRGTEQTGYNIIVGRDMRERQ